MRMLVSLTALCWVCAAAKVSWFSSTESVKYVQKEISSLNENAPTECSKECLLVSKNRAQTVQGFGACFNEMGWEALQSLSQKDRDDVMHTLFSPRKMHFTYNRVPVGANDYALGWYSHDEMPPGQKDFSLGNFSIDRDLKRIIPYIKLAQSYMDPSDSRRLFASAWSPPAWMKLNDNYTGCGPLPNTLDFRPEVQKAYANYLAKFVAAYSKEGISVTAMMVQNEPYATGCDYPKCNWSGAQMRDFIKLYLGPIFRDTFGDKVEVWLGTLNTDDFNECPNTVFSDEDAAAFLSGAAFQWAGKGAIQRMHETFPNVPLIQSENECGDGKNTWDYAMYVFDLMRHYFGNGAVAYTYWNPILSGNGTSYWGWKQNSMFTVDDGKLTVNSDYYPMLHLSHSVKPGAVRLLISGDWSGNALAFENPDGRIAITVANPHTHERNITLVQGDSIHQATLQPRSLNTFL